jgi:hypothetical protein
MTETPGWGGRRIGTPGVAYPQRTDLNASAAPRTGSTPQQGPPQGPSGYIPPDQVPNLTDPTSDDRPVTDGLPVGPGRGPEALGPMPGGQPDLTMPILRALYQSTGSPYLLRLMARKRGVDLAGRVAGL